jgi:orotate phosphoribosyltransferase
MGKRLAASFRNLKWKGDGEAELDLVIGPALGGVIVSYEVARALGVRSLFAERHEMGLELRRGFRITEGERVLVVEDVITTGGSVKEVMSLVRNAGAEVVGIGCVVDRSSGRGEFDVPVVGLVKIDARDFDPAECPLCAAGLPIQKPGSRPES